MAFPEGLDADEFVVVCVDCWLLTRRCWRRGILSRTMGSSDSILFPNKWRSEVREIDGADQEEDPRLLRVD